MKLKFIIVLFLTFTSCRDDATQINAKQLLEKTIIASGGDKFFNSKIQFDLDILHYDIYRKNNISNFEITRQVDSIVYKATYNNGDMAYYVNDEKQEKSMSSILFLNTYLKGFIYLSSIPHILKQNSVLLSRLNDVKIENTNYYTLYVTYKELEDYPQAQDEFYLYINPETNYIDFYAQKHYLTGDKMLFKKAINSRTINGIRFSDYKVLYLKSKTNNYALKEFYKLYNKNELTTHGEIKFQNVEVELL